MNPSPNSNPNVIQYSNNSNVPPLATNQQGNPSNATSSLSSSTSNPLTNYPNQQFPNLSHPSSSQPSVSPDGYSPAMPTTSTTVLNASPNVVLNHSALNPIHPSVLPNNSQPPQQQNSQIDDPLSLSISHWNNRNSNNNGINSSSNSSINSNSNNNLINSNSSGTRTRPLSNLGAGSNSPTKPVPDPVASNSSNLSTPALTLDVAVPSSPVRPGFGSNFVVSPTSANEKAGEMPRPMDMGVKDVKTASGASVPSNDLRNSVGQFGSNSDVSFQPRISASAVDPSSPTSAHAALVHSLPPSSFARPVSPPMSSSSSSSAASKSAPPPADPRNSEPLST
eukprot:CAMPEP_0175084534 /NCGR_PEP_ID=MMETSP0052_2-20121109/28114_1 /TAXON_ID=51329 ORGANISM="Polytomella parva, Strain SAG 63-3" /NCGR_SAMPLE_ID=MMETSP0052_2 /ASSEMBLY_ACC=CAM_ASM_000194 /LENGTH=336 /DNA_ID=CAMNT_0016356351 /DNA_START=330 /DNA_END=1336 /DNA_ORIENTATION=-